MNATPRCGQCGREVRVLVFDENGPTLQPCGHRVALTFCYPDPEQSEIQFDPEGLDALTGGHE